MKWHTTTTHKRDMSEYASAEPLAPSEAKYNALQKTHDKLQAEVDALHAAIHVRMFLLDMLPTTPDPATVRVWLDTIDKKP
jgi:hypothetical protein